LADSPGPSYYFPNRGKIVPQKLWRYANAALRIKAEGGPHRVFFGPFPLLARRRVSRPHLRGSLELFSPECKITQGLSVSRKVQLRVKPPFGRPSIGYRWAISSSTASSARVDHGSRPLSEELGGLLRESHEDDA
jgi:hypothetical protein